MNKPRVFLALFVPLTACTVVAAAAVSHAVYYHDQVLTRDARQINGRVYVPLADVARALGGHVAAHGGDLEIATSPGAPTGTDASRTAAGGTNEVRGANGALGDWFFTGNWRFRAIRMERAASYAYQYGSSAGTDKPSGDNDELVIVHCTIKNGRKATDSPILTVHGLSSQATAVTDNEGQSYPPIDFDVRNGDLVPGAARNFAVIFSVPKGTTLKDMIFTAYGYGSSAASNVRVSLATP